jgi:hypothetical protein
MEEYVEASALCHRVLDAKPHHFGAAEGLLMSSMHVGDKAVARAALERCRALIPHSER